MRIKDLLLKKGGAGVSMSRPETVERLNPLIRRFYELFYSYGNVIRRHPERDVVARLEAFQKVNSVDIGKLSETVLSAGGVPYSGTDLEPTEFDLGTDAGRMVAQLRELESGLAEALAAEDTLGHHIRTRAVLALLHKNTKERLAFLESLAGSTKKRS